MSQKTKKASKSQKNKCKEIKNVKNAEEIKDTDNKKVSKKRKKNPEHVHESTGQNKALRYLKIWYANKKSDSTAAENTWKFEKCRQIWLLQNCYCNKKVPKDDFKILLKYMKTIRGRMRDATLKDAEQKIEFSQKWDELASNGKLEADIAIEMKKPKLDNITVKRANKIVKKLSSSVEETEETKT